MQSCTGHGSNERLDEAALAGEREEVLHGILLAAGGGSCGGPGRNHLHRPVERIDIDWLLWLWLLLWLLLLCL